MRINIYLGAGEVMKPSKIQDPEGAKTVVMTFKIAVGAVATVHMHTFKIICFSDTTRGILRVDTNATSRGKHNPSKQGRKSILIHKSYMDTHTCLVGTKQMRLTSRSTQTP